MQLLRLVTSLTAMECKPGITAVSVLRHLRTLVMLTCTLQFLQRILSLHLSASVRPANTFIDWLTHSVVEIAPFIPDVILRHWPMCA